MHKSWLKAGAWCEVVLVALLWSASAAAADPRQAEVEALAKKYWAAEVKQDFGAVWDLLGTLQQTADKRDDYVKLRTEKITWRAMKADVEDVDVDGDLAWVRVKADYTMPQFPGYPTQTFDRWQQWRHADRWYPLGPREVGNWPELPPKMRPVADEAVLKARVAAMWKAKVDQDWKTIYGFMSPAFRAVVPLDAFMHGKAKLLYVSAKVDWVEAKDSEAKARVSFSYKQNEPAMSKMKPTDDTIVEPWIKADGNWYMDSIVPEVPQPQQAEAAKQAN